MTLEDLREHKAVLERLEFATYFDPLTGLANRLLFQSRLEQSLHNAERAGELVALLLLNLNRFKEINNSFSYAAGNALLQEIGTRIGTSLRKSDTLARLHGDRFVILLEHLTTGEPVAMITRKIFRALASPFFIDDHEVFLTASIGIALFPDDGCSAEGLLKNAETAMYRARERKNNRFQFYTQEMNARTRERMNLESALYRALEREEFELFYQPQISPPRGTITGVEALLRWRHPEKGILPPLEFIPLLEENGLIVQVGQWVLREACRQARRWHDQGFPSMKMAVNISPRQLQEKDFVPFLQNLLGETGLLPGSLVVELTESCLVHNAEENTLLFAAIAQLGVLIAIDDFGTGFSSLSYLKHLPVHALKIDRCFVQGITENRHDAAIGFAILSLAEKLGLQVTAEGVEKPEQMRLLSNWRCDQVQGFLFAPPMPAPHIVDWLRGDLPALSARYFPDTEAFDQAENGHSPA